MVDLFMLCADFKNNQSELRQRSNLIIAEIYNYLKNSSKKTEFLVEGWKEEFSYIYGDINTNLSSNNKLNKKHLIERYGISISEGESEVAVLQMLFFSVQTFFSILTKCVMKNILQGIRCGSDYLYSDTILGKFASDFGISNYCSEDWYCWPVFEMKSGFTKVMDEIELIVQNYQSLNSLVDFQVNSNYDYIKQIYEAVIPKELRHALGEYYTPDWLAESTLKSTLDAANISNIKKVSIMDPTCGSGTFLFKAISLKRRNGANLQDVLDTVYGVDINPLAVLTAKTNYLLSILDLLSENVIVTLPVYKMDIIKLAEKINLIDDCETEHDFLRAGNPVSIINYQSYLDKLAVSSIDGIDVIVGNPPWVNWEYLPEKYRTDSQHIWLDYKLFSAKGRDLSFSKEDISILITYIVMDKLLKEDGVIGVVIRQGVFKSAQNGVGFRKFFIRDAVPVKVIKVDDLSKIRAFDNATNNTAVFIGQKGSANSYPVSYFFWEKRKDVKKLSFGAYSDLQEVTSQIAVEELCAIPVVKEDITSLWVTASGDKLNTMKTILGTNSYRARTGVFTGGANAVYWLKIDHSSEDGITINNVVERAKRKSEKITAEIESEFIYPMLKGSNIRKWNFTYDTYLLCPHTSETKMWPVSQEILDKKAPKTFEYLSYFKEDLDGRNGFAGWEKEIQRQEFHAILRVGDYTFSKYKVVWKYIASEFICAVISSVNDSFLGEKLLLPNEKVMYVSTESELEAYYLCGVLSSTVVAECVKSYMNPTSISAHVLNKLNIPDFSGNDPIHLQIANLCKLGHSKKTTTPFIEEIDKLVMNLYR